MNKAYFTLCDYLHLLEDWKIAYAPKAPKTPKTTEGTEESEAIEQTELIHPLFVEACHQLDYIQYLVDCLSTADYEEQIQFYQSHRGELIVIASKIKQHTESRIADKSA